MKFYQLWSLSDVGFCAVNDGVVKVFAKAKDESYVSASITITITGQLLTNGGFEQDLTGWDIWGGTEENRFFIW